MALAKNIPAAIITFGVWVLLYSMFGLVKSKYLEKCPPEQYDHSIYRSYEVAQHSSVYVVFLAFLLYRLQRYINQKREIRKQGESVWSFKASDSLKTREKYRCNVCGKEVVVTKVGGSGLVCCGQPMEKISD